MRRTKEDSEKTKEAILDAAVKMFSEKGVNLTTLSEIAQEAGVTRGAVYWHFNDKMDLFDALHERMYKPISEILLQELDGDHPDPIRRLKEICIYLIKGLDSSPQKRQALKLFWVKCDYTGEWKLFREKHFERKHKSKELFSRYFKEAQEKGMLSKNMDPEILTLSIGCFMKGIIVEHIKEPDLYDLQKDGPKMIEQFFRSLII